MKGSQKMWAAIILTGITLGLLNLDLSNNLHSDIFGLSLVLFIVYAMFSMVIYAQNGFKDSGGNTPTLDFFISISPFVALYNLFRFINKLADKHLD